MSDTEPTEKEKIGCVAVVMLLLGAALASLIWYKIYLDVFHDAVKHDAGYYSAKTGYFKWQGQE